MSPLDFDSLIEDLFDQPDGLLRVELYDLIPADQWTQGHILALNGKTYRVARRVDGEIDGTTLWLEAI